MGAKSFCCLLGLVSLLGNVPFSIAACSNEATEYYTKGVKLGETYVKLGKPCQNACLQEKLYFFRRAVELCPGSAEMQNDLADVYERLGQYPEAIGHYQQAIKLEPDLPVPYLSLGDLYLNASDYKNAVEYFDKGLRLDPEDRLKKKAARDAAFRLSQGNAKLDQQSISGVLGGGELSVMDPAGVRPDRKIAVPINFKTGSDQIAPESAATVRELGTALKEILANSNSAAFVIEGHTDSRGDDLANLKLSQLRAKRIAETLAQDFQLPADRFAVKGFGETRPVSPGSTEQDHARNRRVEIVRVDVSDLPKLASTGAAEPLKANHNAAPSPLTLEAAVYVEDAQSRPKKLEAGETLKSGDGYRVYFLPKQDAYVYVVQKDATGKLFYLFPNAEWTSKDNFVHANTPYWLPAKDRWFELDKTQGHETIHIIASSERRSDIEDLVSRADAGKASDEFTSTLKLMGVKGVRADRNVDVDTRDQKTVAAPLDQFSKEGEGVAYSVGFKHQ